MKVLFRTDASAAMGTGHVMRCIALVQTMAETGADSVFLASTITPTLKTKLRDEGLKNLALAAAPYGEKDARETAMKAKELGAEWIVVDGYGFGADYQKILKNEGLRVLFIDDYGHADHYSADIVLNQNISAREELYEKKDSQTRLLLGPRYVLLRREFREWKDRRMERKGPVKNLLVTLGGADPQNMTGKIVSALEKTNFPGDVTVIVGGSNTHRDALRRQAASSTLSMSIVTNVADMPARMAEADAAICAAGTTGWELLFMGVPFITGAFAENQIKVAEALQTQDLAENAGWYPDAKEDALAKRIDSLIKNEQWRSVHSQKGMDTVDGDGAMRVWDAMRGLATVTLRDAVKNDMRLMHGWANDPMIRASSFSPDPILWEDHQRWMEKKLDDPQCRIFVGMDGQRPIGQIRFDIREDGDAEIDVHLAPDARGKGYGTPLIKEGMKRFLKGSTVKTVHAYAKADNDASRKAFMKAGFIELEKETRPALSGVEGVYHLVSPHP